MNTTLCTNTTRPRYDIALHADVDDIEVKVDDVDEIGDVAWRLGVVILLYKKKLVVRFFGLQ